MNEDSDAPYQSRHLKQKAIISSKSLKLPAVLAAVLIIALTSGAGGYLLGTRSRQPAPSKKSTRAMPTVPRPFPSSFSQGSEAEATTAANWKTHTSSYGYSVRYPSDMKHEEPGGYPVDLRIKNEDLTMTFMLQTLPHNKKIEEYATNAFCDDRPNEIKKEKINNVLVYRVEKTLSDNKLCLQAIIGLNTFLINPSQPKSQWILDIQALGNNHYSTKLFNNILSTVSLTQ
jgi:hypothetical protein